VRNIKLEIEYDGTHFYGWQIQGNTEQRTVQAEIEKALKQILNEDVKIIGAGRTDAGVHAISQIANFLTQGNFSTSIIKKALNAVLPDDIVIKSVTEVSQDFNSRFSAIKRKYRYIISLEPTAIERGFCWEVKYKIDVELMKSASVYLLGRHDFSSFCPRDFERENRFCDVKEVSFKKKSGRLIFEITADRFLRNMVRAIVGTLIDVGRGKIPVSYFKEIIDTKDRTKAGKTAPAQGLFLVKVYYK
jgi:tRNA pseudouridine38-40 synthase